jgi:hypothetical protein
MYLHFQIRASAEKVKQKKLPALFSSTQDDKICEWPLNLELSKACGLQDQNIMLYDKEENLTQDAKGRVDNIISREKCPIIFIFLRY